MGKVQVDLLLPIVHDAGELTGSQRWGVMDSAFEYEEVIGSQFSVVDRRWQVDSLHFSSQFVRCGNVDLHHELPPGLRNLGIELPDTGHW